MIVDLCWGRPTELCFEYLGFEAVSFTMEIANFSPATFVFFSSLKIDFDKPIVTEITKLEDYYKAEDYHQNYYNNNPGNPYCQVVIKPKLEKFNNK